MRYATDTGSPAAELGAARPDSSRAESGRALALSMTWAEAAARHLEFYRAFGPPPPD